MFTLSGIKYTKKKKEVDVFVWNCKACGKGIEQNWEPINMTKDRTESCRYCEKCDNQANEDKKKKIQDLVIGAKITNIDLTVFDCGQRIDISHIIAKKNDKTYKILISDDNSYCHEIEEFSNGQRKDAD